MKLDKFQKAKRKELKEYFGKRLHMSVYNRVTIAVEKTGPGRGKVAWSIHSVDDGKAHRKYGEWVALNRLFNGCGMPVEFCGLDDLEEMIFRIAEQVTYN